MFANEVLDDRAQLTVKDFTATENGAIGELVEKIKARFPEALLGYREQRTDDPVLVVRAEDVVEVARFLRHEPGLEYNHLADLTAIDRQKLGMEPRFAAVYQLYSIPHRKRVRLIVPAPGGDNGTVPSLIPVWPGANWYEREAYDLMGLRFKTHPDLRRILMPDDWVGHPLRKDYPLGNIPVPFTVNWDDPEFETMGQQVMPAEMKPPTVYKGLNTQHMIINMGPQHPSTHGVLRLIVELDGERVQQVMPDLGYLHSGFEKEGESKRYKDFVYYTDRMDYVSAMSNNLGYCLAVEKLLDIEIPERAQVVRVMMAELQRLANHLLWLGTHSMDIGGTALSLMMYCFREREMILDIFELVCGARLTTSYIRIGGLWQDVPPAFKPRVRELLDYFPARIDEYERMLTRNPIWRQRVTGIGKITYEQAIDWSLSGPMARGSGVDYDLRRDMPYSGYDQYEFDVPVLPDGDCYARYLVRMEEMRQSLRILEQAWERLPEGPYKTSDRKVALPPREELDTSMEALIHHFKLVTEGFKPNPGDVYHAVESPKGELGYYIISDGSPIPYRCRVRGPSFVNLQVIDLMSRNHLLSDVVANIGSIDIVLGEVDR